MSNLLKKALIPRTVVALSELRWPGRLRAQVRRALGGRGRIELYFAFDDPYSAIALPPLLAITQRHEVELVLYPLVERGIEGDPALSQRRQQAIVDSSRLARRQGLTLGRRNVLDPAAPAFLVAWLESARGSEGINSFAAAALQQLWFGTTGAVNKEDYAALFERHLGRKPPTDLAINQHAARDNLQRLQRKGHWESPAAWVDGEWFFAHERFEQIEARLNYLGW
ncbi:MAG: hypothetical protein ACRETN_08070 [Nevskiales bacterium]